MTLFTRDSLERMGVTTRSIQSERGPRVKLHRNAKTTPNDARIDRSTGPSGTLAARRGGGRRRASACAPPTSGCGGTASVGGRRLRMRPLDRIGSRGGRHRPSRPHRRGALRAAHGLGHRRAAPGPALDRRRRLDPGWAESAWRRLTPPAPSPATNGRSPASWCISMSNRSRALPAWAIAFMVIAAQRVEGIGWEYAHVAVDDHSRAAYVEVLPGSDGRHHGGLSSAHRRAGLPVAASASRAC